MDSSQQPPITAAQFWLDRGAVWRLARAPQRCDDCGGAIPARVTYLDTHERQDGRHWATIKICRECSAQAHQ